MMISKEKNNLKYLITMKLFYVMQKNIKKKNNCWKYNFKNIN